MNGLRRGEGVYDYDVLIVGGGPVGLAASILLSVQGVRSLLVERHPGTSPHPKAPRINARTMGIFRQCGFEPAVQGGGLPQAAYRYLVWARTLAGEGLERRPYGKNTADVSLLSPSRHCL